MNPSDPSSFNHRTERLSTGNTYHFVDQIPEGYDVVKTPTLLCVHGFPDLWYGWRHVIAPWVSKCRWRVVVPDMLGYGGTDKPSDPKHYSTRALSADLAALLDLIGVRKAVVAGHDWGAATAWRFALWHPDRVHALAVLSIPFTPPRQDYLSLEQIVQRLPIYGYQLYFGDPASTKEIEANLPAFFRLIHSWMSIDRNITQRGKISEVLKSGALSADTYLSDKEFQYYIHNFKTGGMTGPLNYYRTTKHRFDEEVGTLPVSLPKSLPVLFLWGDKDAVCSPSQVGRMKEYIPSLRVVQVFEKGHWLMAQCPDVVASSIAEFVRSVTEKAQAKL
ncbi:alpha beta-hydrolase [Hysterangium stoloniferum]|nr:alpha beta-hydrolase [Hysterangium stoloniferum]